MKKMFAAALFLAAFAASLTGQQTGTCGMSREMLDQVSERFDRSRAEAHEHAHDVQDRGGAFKYVPVRFILVADADGSGRASEGRVLDALCCMNEEYESVGFRFYLKDNDFKYLNHSGANILQSGINETVMEQNDNESAINYFILKTPDYGNNPTGGVILGYYTPSRDWLVIRKDQLACASSTLEHETGHFFSLMHPFNGWDHAPWANGAAYNSCAPISSPGGPLTEKVDGSNGATAADKISDTPASYNFLYEDSNCAGGYGGQAKDPDCVPLAGKVMADNYMDYFEACAQYKFTQGQIDQMHADLNSNSRNFLDNTFAPIAETIATPPAADVLLEPAVNATTTNFDNITFRWKSVAGATHYLLEVGVNSTMTAISFAKLLKDTTWTGNTGITAGAARYWRITPINQFYTCSNSTGSFKFTAGQTSATSDIEGLTGWAVSPNPASSASALVLQTVAEKAFEADVEIVSISGQRVFFRPGAKFFEGENSLVLDAEKGLAAGAYMVSLVQKNARQTQKLIVID